MCGNNNNNNPCIHALCQGRNCETNVLGGNIGCQDNAFSILVEFNRSMFHNCRQFFYVPGQRFWSLITRAKPAKVLEPPLFGSRRGGLHALLRRRPCS